VVIGWPIELAGILLVAAPDWWPGVKRWLVAVGRRIERLARRILRRPGHQVIAAGTATSHGTASGVGITTIPADAPIERQLEYLRGQVAELQGHVGRLLNTVRDELPAQWRSDIERSESGLRGEMAGSLERLRSEYKRARRVGLASLLVGGTMLAAANLI
jgi:hypothetical protein